MADEPKGMYEANFGQFINGLAVQTLVHLGRMSNPMTGETATDMPNAKYSIDILAILQEKTKGNLTPEESEYLSTILRDLRLEYVRVGQGGGACGCGCGGDTNESECGCDGEGDNCGGDSCGCSSDDNGGCGCGK